MVVEPIHAARLSWTSTELGLSCMPLSRAFCEPVEPRNNSSISPRVITPTRDPLASIADRWRCCSSPILILERATETMSAVQRAAHRHGYLIGSRIHRRNKTVAPRFRASIRRVAHWKPDYLPPAPRASTPTERKFRPLTISEQA